VARQVYRTAAWRPLPHRTVLLTDELDAYLDWFAARTGEPVSPADHALIAQVHVTLLWALRSPCDLGCRYRYFGTIEEHRASPPEQAGQLSHLTSTDLDLTQITRFLSTVADSAIRRVFLAGGEPLIWPHTLAASSYPGQVAATIATVGTGTVRGCFGAHTLAFVDPDGSVWDCPSSPKITATSPSQRRSIRDAPAATLFPPHRVQGARDVGWYLDTVCRFCLGPAWSGRPQELAEQLLAWLPQGRYGHRAAGVLRSSALAVGAGQQREPQPHRPRVLPQGHGHHQRSALSRGRRRRDQRPTP